MKKYIWNIPINVVNLISVISGIVTVITPIVSVVLSVRNKLRPNILWVCCVIVLAGFCVLLLLRMRKYRMLANSRMEKTSFNFHKALHETRNLFFDAMHNQKLDNLTETLLNITYKEKLSGILDNLCETLVSFTDRPISACIKLNCFSSQNGCEDINQENVELITFCRSHNSVTDRGNYERCNRKIFLDDNTDFKEIISNDNHKDYFYQPDLLAYNNKLKSVESSYKNTNTDWERYYKSTIVVPIRIEFNRLYHIKKDTSYHIIGFLCVDSEHRDAFTEKQEKYNVGIVNAYADIIYVLLSQYRHYLNKLYAKSDKEEVTV